MADAPDWKSLRFAVTTRTDLGVFLLAAGLGATGDAIWNFAPHAEFYALAPWIGAIGLGLKKLVFDRNAPDQLTTDPVSDKPTTPTVDTRSSQAN